MPGRSLYLKMKLFLNRHSRTSSQVCSKVLVGLAAEADDEVAGDRRVGQPLADAGVHLAVVLDRVAALHPLQHVVASRSAPARAGTGHTFGRSRTAASRSSVMSFGIVRDELDPLDARRSRAARASRSLSRVVRSPSR